jgi:pimeloyl-ACP methyl ester carboxylesterase
LFELFNVARDEHYQWPLHPYNLPHLFPALSPVEIYYRDEGAGPPLVLLHGGWGYTLNPFNRQIEKLRTGVRVICPDRSGYGRSTHLDAFGDLPTDFHYRAAAETLSFLDSLRLALPHYSFTDTLIHVPSPVS